jgi:hypothetical protein
VISIPQRCAFGAWRKSSFCARDLQPIFYYRSERLVHIVDSGRRWALHEMKKSKASQQFRRFVRRD